MFGDAQDAAYYNESNELKRKTRRSWPVEVCHAVVRVL
jgi:hypothetical protein